MLMIRGVWGQTMSQNRQFEWVRELKGPRERIKNESCDPQPRRIIADDNICPFESLLNEIAGKPWQVSHQKSRKMVNSVSKKILLDGLRGC